MKGHRGVPKGCAPRVAGLVGQGVSCWVGAAPSHLLLMVALLRGKVAADADGAPASQPLFRCKDSPGISRCHSDDDDGVGSPSLRPRRGGDTPQDHALQPHSQAAVAEAPNLQHRVLPDDQTIEHKVNGGIQSSNLCCQFLRSLQRRSQVGGCLLGRFKGEGGGGRGGMERWRMCGVRAMCTLSGRGMLGHRARLLQSFRLPLAG